MAVMIPRSQPRGSAAGDTFIPRFYRKTLGAALVVAVTGLMLSAGQAKALTVSVGGLDYDVTTFTGSYYGNEGKFNTLDNFGVMPWWGSYNNAISFAAAVGTQLAQQPDSIIYYPVNNYLALFGYTLSSRVDTSLTIESVLYGAASTFSVGTPAVPLTWAQATLIGSTSGGGGTSAGGSTSGDTASVPGPLPILGLAAAFGFSRKLRNRIKLHSAEQIPS